MASDIIVSLVVDYGVNSILILKPVKMELILSSSYTE